MSKENTIEVKGIVQDVGRNGICTVKLDNEKIIQGIISGKIRTFRIKILKGDRVTIAMSPYDSEKGRIIHREKINKSYTYTPSPNKK